MYRLLPLTLALSISLASGAEVGKTATSRPTVGAPDAAVATSASSASATVRVDRLLADHWRSAGIYPAEVAGDEEFLRRLTLDLTGRVPTLAEQEAFLAAPSSVRRTAAIDRLLAGPEFPLHLARVLDEWIQRTQQGDEAFVEWLRASLRDGRSWDAIFRAVLVGPWTETNDKPANKFLVKRAKNLDSLTADAGRAFFGVDITCARCHDHPLVDEWKQDHYYGLAAFFHRTQISGKDKASVDEKKEGELTFEARFVGQKTAAPLYLTERTIDVAAKGSRREQLVAVALDERSRFSKAAANRMWAWFFGRGLVEPVDQLHSANPPSVPGVLEFLADDFAAHDYDLQRLVRVIVSTQAYQLSSRHAASPDPGAFAAATLRPLTPRQFALALVSATGELGPTAASKENDDAGVVAYREREKRAAALLPDLDTTIDGYRPGVGEALFMSNHATIQKMFVPEGANLAARLATAKSPDKRTTAAFRTLLGRRPTTAEQCELATTTDAVLLWILATSAEFRFNH